LATAPKNEGSKHIPMPVLALSVIEGLLGSVANTKRIVLRFTENSSEQSVIGH